MDPVEMMITDLNCEYLGLSRLCLMESAGKSLSDEVAAISTFKFSKPIKIIIFAGSGGNGGDGFVAARYLLNRGYEVEIVCLSPYENIKSEDAKTNLTILKNMNPRLSKLTIHEIKEDNDFDKIRSLKTDNELNDLIIIDALIGTGIKGKLRPKIRKSIEIINQSKGLIIAVDIPSGINPMTGEILDLAVKAEYTVTFHKIKKGVKLASEEYVGGLVTTDIGIPQEAELFVGFGDLIKLKTRRNISHKGNNGKLLIIGGSKDYSGAPAISGMSAIASGADMVHVCAPDSASLAIKSLSPNLIVKSLEGDYLNLNHLDEILKISEKVDAVLIGPGAGLDEETGKLFNTLVHKVNKPLVLDADALKLVDLKLIKNKEDLIITPHFYEFKEFFSEIIEKENIPLKKLERKYTPLDYKLNNEKIELFQKITGAIKGTTILKGAYDLILQNKRVKVNKTGNPGMTVGGTGDSLSGIAVSLLSQDMDSFDAGSLAIYLNGRAGDLAMNKQGYGFSATDITEYLGALMANIIK